MAATPITKLGKLDDIAGAILFGGSGPIALVPVPSGPTNGVTFAFSANDLIVLAPGPIGTATYTFITPETAAQTAYGATASNPTVAVALTALKCLRIAAIFKGNDNQVTVTCDVNGQIGVIPGA